MNQVCKQQVKLEQNLVNYLLNVWMNASVNCRYGNGTAGSVTASDLKGLQFKSGDLHVLYRIALLAIGSFVEFWLKILIGKGI